MRTIIIDGYNVLLGIGMLKIPPLGSQLSRGQLQKARERFLSSLSALPKEVCRQIVIVFDSAMRLPELPDKYLHNSMEVCFASGHQDADEMIVQWLQKHSSPKQVLVVSSDHEIQTFAKRRKSSFQDSVPWFEQFVENPSAWPKKGTTNTEEEKNRPLDVDVEDFLSSDEGAVSLDFAGPQGSLPSVPESEEDLENWLVEFDDQFEKNKQFQGPEIGRKKQEKTEFVIESDQDNKKARESGEHLPVSSNQSNEEMVAGSHPALQKADLPEKVDQESEVLLDQSAATIDSEPEADQNAPDGPLDKIEDIDEKQMNRWNRQLDQHTASPFPPGYGEDLLLGQPLPSNDPRDRWINKKKK